MKTKTFLLNHSFFMTVPSGSFTCPLIYSLIKYLFTIYYVPGTALGTEITLKKKKTDKAPLFKDLIYYGEVKKIIK